MIVFKNKELQRQFERDGFAVADLLSVQEVADLRHLYYDTKSSHLSVTEKMHSTCDTGNLKLVLQVDDKLKSVILPKLDTILESYEPLLGSFLVKETGDGSETGFHQDPTLVEDRQFTSGNVWVALQDTNSHNGNLRVIKGSHRMVDTLIATPNCPVSYGSFRHRLLEFATEIPVKAGQAIFLNHKLIHGATPNHSQEERIAAIIAIKSAAAQWRFLYMDSNDRVEAYRIDTRSFASLIKNQRPTEAEFLGHIAFDFPQISEEAFIAFMNNGGHNHGIKSRVLSMLKGLFSQRI